VTAGRILLTVAVALYLTVSGMRTALFACCCGSSFGRRPPMRPSSRVFKCSSSNHFLVDYSGFCWLAPIGMSHRQRR
jgi:hypothetical protein